MREDIRFEKILNKFTDQISKTIGCFWVLEYFYMSIFPILKENGLNGLDFYEKVIFKALITDCFIGFYKFFDSGKKVFNFEKLIKSIPDKLKSDNIMKEFNNLKANHEQTIKELEKIRHEVLAHSNFDYLIEEKKYFDDNFNLKLEKIINEIFTPIINLIYYSVLNEKFDMDKKIETMDKRIKIDFKKHHPEHGLLK
jgi:hypothetical protein